MNKNKKGILLALCLVLAVPVCGSGLPAQATSMSSITSDSIREKQDQINQAQKERETMKSNLSNLEQIKKLRFWTRSLMPIALLVLLSSIQMEACGSKFNCFGQAACPTWARCLPLVSKVLAPDGQN